ncbi:MAG: hypothetical protein CME65_11115 [Halobacteriovoraceae bacterium]|nr:hypothetical protein [Halobacteriovoraceae bacterium]|tara:strand:- start:6299 stop:7267 length:969 start_codon:yes stop_codon:yes gene_type:complete
MSMLDRIEEKINKINIDQDILYKKWNIQHRDELFTSVYWSYFPMTEKYFFEANPAFFYEYKNLFDFGRYPLCLVRDGFLGILDFFLVHSKPSSDFASTLLIPKEFEKLVPKTWKDQVAVYEFYNKKKNIEPSEQVVIYGTPTAEVFYQYSVSELAQWVSVLKAKYQQYLFCVPIRESLLASDKVNREMKFIQFLKEIYRHCGFDVDIFHDDIEKRMKNLEGSQFHYSSFDRSKIFISDNYYDHFLSSIGGTNLDWSFEKEGGLKYELSGEHGIRFSELNLDNNCFGEFFLQFKLSGSRTKSIYEIFQSPDVQKTYLKNFSKA